MTAIRNPQSEIRNSDLAIRCEGLSKRYRIGEQERYKALRDVITDTAGAPFRRLHAMVRAGNSANGDGSEIRNSQSAIRNSHIWALDNVSFAVKQGDVVGIIGRNGAGKSTLLKILSRITKPTKGHAEIHGRVGSLLEVGTGFHPELTGRENIYLNGAILGMRKAEIELQFDEIVAFAEVEKFIDTPVKRYSSGMHVRLAFAVAAHMQTEILLVDEVLAVGDAEFQKKCLGKMGDVAKQGRTVMFVSHNSGAVAGLCSRGIILEKGRVRADASSLEALSVYSSGISKKVFVADGESEKPHIRKVVLDEDELSNGNLVVDVHFSSPFELSPPIVGIIVHNAFGMPLIGSNPRFHSQDFNAQKLSAGVATMTMKNIPLHSGSYKISIWLSDCHQDFDVKTDVLTFEYVAPQCLTNLPPVEVIGPIKVPASWKLST